MSPASDCALLPADRFSEVFGSRRGSGRPDDFFRWTSAKGNEWALTLVDEAQVTLSAAATPQTHCWLAPLRRLCEVLCAPIHEARIYAADNGLYVIDGQDLLRLRVWASQIVAEQLSAGNVPPNDIPELEAFVAVMGEHGEDMAEAQARIDAARAEQRGVEVGYRDAFVALRDCMRQKVPSRKGTAPDYVEDGQFSGLDDSGCTDPC